MILKLRIRGFKATLTLAKVIDVQGVNSLLPDGNHILMWDFDDKKLEDVLTWLEPIQWFYKLPNIYVLNTGKEESFIAYCFKKIDFMSACAIIASTPGVCRNFFKWGVFRKRFTLRVGPKCGRIPKLAAVIQSPIPEDAYIAQLNSWVQYETLADGNQGPFYIIEVG